MRFTLFLIVLITCVLGVFSKPGIQLRYNCGQGWKNSQCFCSANACSSATNRIPYYCQKLCASTYECGTCLG